MLSHYLLLMTATFCCLLQNVHTVTVYPGVRSWRWPAVPLTNITVISVVKHAQRASSTHSRPPVSGRHHERSFYCTAHPLMWRSQTGDVFPQAVRISVAKVDISVVMKKAISYPTNRFAIEIKFRFISINSITTERSYPMIEGVLQITYPLIG